MPMGFSPWHFFMLTRVDFTVFLSIFGFTSTSNLHSFGKGTFFEKATSTKGTTTPNQTRSKPEGNTKHPQRKVQRYSQPH